MLVLANSKDPFSVSKIHQTQTPCGFRLVGTAFSSWRGLPIILREDPGFGGPEIFKMSSSIDILCNLVFLNKSLSTVIQPNIGALQTFKTKYYLLCMKIRFELVGIKIESKRT